MPNFVHLHNHTAMSTLDGVESVESLVQKAKEVSMPAIALTDHGNIQGEYLLYKACKATGVQPILGLEGYMLNPFQYVSAVKNPQMDKGMLARDIAYPIFEKAFLTNQYSRLNHHVLFLALNQKGLENIHHLTTYSHMVGFYYKPTLNHQFIAEHSEGVLITSACLAGEIPSLIKIGMEEEAEQLMQWYIETFPGRYAMEIQRHNMPELENVNQKVIQLAKKHNVPVIITNDIHYLKAEDKKIQDVLINIGVNSGKNKKNDTNTDENSKQGFYIHGDGYHFREQAEIEKVFGDLPDYQEYMENTFRIASEVSYETTIPVSYQLPDIFPGKTKDERTQLLRERCLEGAEKRYGQLNQEIRDRIEEELDVISSMGFVDYFFIIADIIEFARSKNQLWNIRGSGGGSIILYSLGLSDTEPLEHGLLFERFLNKTRVSMPDVDIDVADNFRPDVADYLKKKYGEEHVARILAFGEMKLRNALRDVARLNGVAPANINIISKAIGDDVKTVDELLEDERFNKLIHEYPAADEILQKTRYIVGQPKSISTHPAGILITPEPIYRYTAMHHATKVSGEGGSGSSGEDNSSDSDETISDLPPVQIDMESVELAKLLKVDILGLITLNTIANAIKIINKKHNIGLTYDTIPYTYNDSYEIFSKGDTTGIFQFGSDGMRDILRQLKPKHLSQLIAIVALYRPGPMDNIPQYIKCSQGEETPTYFAEEFKSILEETYGIVIYQEQIMQIMRLAGFSGAEADNVRRAISKKKTYEMDKYKEQFVKFMHEKFRMSAQKAGAEVWDKFIMRFAGYGFNKSHAASYAIMAAKTAWLKYNYRAEFLMAALNSESKLEKQLLYVSDARLAKIKILPPDVNRSVSEFEEEEGNIRYGLKTIKHVQVDSVKNLIQEREASGEYKDAQDFIFRAAKCKIDTGTISALLLSGALDCLAPEDEPNKRTFIYNKFPPKYQVSALKMTTQKAVPNSLLEWLKAEYLVADTFLTQHPLKLLIDANHVPRTSRIIYPDFVGTRTKPGNTFTVVGIVKDILIKKNPKGFTQLFFNIYGFNPPPIRVAVFREAEQISKKLEEDYLAVLTLYRSDRGYSVKSIQSIGYMFSASTYITDNAKSFLNV